MATTARRPDVYRTSVSARPCATFWWISWLVSVSIYRSFLLRFSFWNSLRTRDSFPVDNNNDSHFCKPLRKALAMPHSRPVLFVNIVAVIAIVLSACGGDNVAGSNDADNADKLSIVVTTNILGDVVTELVGSDGSVDVLLPVGADPHDFQLSARQTGSLRDADLVIANGLNLEEAMTDALEAAEEDGTNVIHVADLVDPIEMGEPDLDHEEGSGDGAGHEHEHEAEHEHKHEDEDEDEAVHGHDHGGLDPHFWLDPVRMAEAVRLIGAELEAVDTTNTETETEWVSRAETLATEIEQAHEGFDTSLSVIPKENRLLLSSHHSLGYFAALYDFEIVGTVVPGGSTLGETSAGDVARLAEIIENEGIPAIFTDVTDTSDLTATVAAEAGVEVVSLYTGSLGDPESGAASYLSMMETNVERIVAALGEGD
ncbi:MAG: hypothetical protein GEU79_07320 [Acidimicrobiia bacterium]|nr:hypothetical protein [Acidimicrobiia bacterium]